MALVSYRDASCLGVSAYLFVRCSSTDTSYSVTYQSDRLTGLADFSIQSPDLISRGFFEPSNLLFLMNMLACMGTLPK